MVLLTGLTGAAEPDASCRFRVKAQAERIVERLG
jgi:hypothetical protein